MAVAVEAFVPPESESPFDLTFAVREPCRQGMLRFLLASRPGDVLCTARERVRTTLRTSHVLPSRLRQPGCSKHPGVTRARHHDINASML